MMKAAQVKAIAEAAHMLGEAGITTITEARLIFGLASMGTVEMSAIARELDMPMSTVSRVAFDLQTRGFLEYVDHATDRRKKLLTANLDVFR